MLPPPQEPFPEFAHLLSLTQRYDMVDWLSQALGENEELLEALDPDGAAERKASGERTDA
jgi:hypothetical protein